MTKTEDIQRQASASSSHKQHQQEQHRRVSRLKIVLLLSSSYLAAAIFIVLLTGSLALLSEAGHMFADIGGLALALFAINYSHKPRTSQRTYGFYRMEIVASLLNSLVLVLLSTYILYKASRRIFEPPQIQGFPIIVAAAIGLAVNFIGMRLLVSSSDSKRGGEREEGEEENLNIRAVYLGTLSDTLGAAGVIAAGIIMLTTKFYLVDPIVSIGLALFMLPRTWSIIKKAIHILMEGTPANISHEEVKQSILQVRGVTGIFELHI
jgi:cobalt-zinc-cadmium efflux system protein